MSSEDIGLGRWAGDSSISSLALQIYQESGETDSRSDRVQRGWGPRKRTRRRVGIGSRKASRKGPGQPVTPSSLDEIGRVGNHGPYLGDCGDPSGVSRMALPVRHFLHLIRLNIICSTPLAGRPPFKPEASPVRTSAGFLGVMSSHDNMKMRFSRGTVSPDRPEA